MITVFKRKEVNLVLFYKIVDAGKKSRTHERINRTLVITVAMCSPAFQRTAFLLQNCMFP